MQNRKNEKAPGRILCRACIRASLPFLLFQEADVFQFQVEHRAAFPAGAGQDGGAPGNDRGRNDFREADSAV